MVCARSEIERMARFIYGLGEGQAAEYEGEDQDWLLTLTRTAKQSISMRPVRPRSTGGGMDFDDGFWTTALGRRYLGAQRDAASHGVTVRRLFILTSPDSGP